MHLAVSIVVYNSDPELLISTLNSLNVAVDYAKVRLPALVVTLCIVENESIRQLNLKQVEAYIHATDSVMFDRIDLKMVGANLGYGRGHNLAMNGADFHLVLNPDVSLSQTALYEGLSYMLSHPRTVLLSPKVVDRNGDNLHPCKRYPTVLDLGLRGFAPQSLKDKFSTRLSRYEMREISARTEPVVGVDIVSGCYMLVRSEALAAIGGFDERFFLYFEDFDLSLRLGRVGEVVYLPAMEVAHYGGNAAKKGLRHIALFAQSAWKFYQRHGWRWL